MHPHKLQLHIVTTSQLLVNLLNRKQKKWAEIMPTYCLINRNTYFFTAQHLRLGFNFVNRKETDYRK